MKSNYFRAIFGTIFMLASLCLCGIVVNLFEFSFELNIISAILMILAIVWIFFRGTNIINSVMYFGGMGFLIYQRGFIPNDKIILFIISFALLSISLAVFGSMGTDKSKLDILYLPQKEANQEYIKVSSLFLKKNLVNNFLGVKGGSLSNKFTSLGYTIPAEAITEDMNLTVNSIFGKVKVVLPTNVNVIINSSSSFGKVKNLVVIPEEFTSTITINATSKFSRIFIQQ